MVSLPVPGEKLASIGITAASKFSSGDRVQSSDGTFENL
jgi:hypothetical protein